ncbi:MAG: TIGR04452 family lipoprotein [Spirochaetales bacterium]|nr:TIGR04452 family lipoprotein [Spirochaetales bacterium]
MARPARWIAGALAFTLTFSTCNYVGLPRVSDYSAEQSRAVLDDAFEFLLLAALLVRSGPIDETILLELLIQRWAHRYRFKLNKNEFYKKKDVDRCASTIRRTGLLTLLATGVESLYLVVLHPDCDLHSSGESPLLDDDSVERFLF